MPAIEHKKKSKASEKDVENRRKIVSAYSEEGRERNLRDANKAKRNRIVLLTVSITLFVLTIVSAILIFYFINK